jgi:twitching motility protein PilT
MKGSDLHIVPGEPPYVRVRGSIEPLRDLGVVSRADVNRMMSELVGDTDIQRFATYGDWDGATTIDGERYRLNFSFVNAGSSEGRQPSFSVRALDSESPTPEALGVPDEVIALCEEPFGLVLVTGPTGSGKSTTLASLVDHINRRRACTILTIEDPIEFVHRSKTALVRQREVGHETTSFALAIKYALRQDPDVVLVGEMRDLETMRAAITLAETGHLVFATLHTPDAAGAVNRIIDEFPPEQHAQIRSQLALNLRGVVAQRLVPTADGAGRVAAFEVLLDTPGVRANIREGKISQIVQQMVPAKGMTTMDRAMAALVERGIITREVAAANVERKEDLNDQLGAGVSSGGAGGRGGYSMRGKSGRR